MSDAGEKFVQEFVIMFGFLGGIWLRVGISPEGAIIDALVEILKEVNPDYTWIPIVFVILSIIFLIITVLKSLEVGGYVGLLAVFLAFVAGYFLNEISVILLFVAIIIGLIAPDTV